MVRETKDILKELCAFKPSSSGPMFRLQHSCYMILIGVLPAEYLPILQKMGESQEVMSTSEDDENQAEYKVLKSEKVESILKHFPSQGQSEELENARKIYFVYEDNFNSSLVNMIEKGSSYEKLKAVCRKYEQTDGVNIDEVMAEHESRANQSYSQFKNKNLSIEEAKALAFSISFYTGAKSETCSRGARLLAHRNHGEAIEEQIEEEMNEAAIILYYLVKALSYIPFYWGYVTRACQLTMEELLIYVPGSLITWIQFSSSKKGKKAVGSGAFSDRNTLFKIFSLTGRPIKEFSNYPDEDEVLFLPHSTFLVFNRKTVYAEGKQFTSLCNICRQYEYALLSFSLPMIAENDTNANKTTATTADIYHGTSSGNNFSASVHTTSKMMHNPANTNIDKLLNNCRMRHLTDSPYNDSYVHDKLGDIAWIPAKDRCQLCEEAIENEGAAVSSWMSVSRGESEWANGFVDFGPVTENLRDFLNMKLVKQEKLLKYPLCIVYVCGLDHFNKCLYVQLMAQQDNISCAIVYRHGYGEEHINQSDKTSKIIYIPLSKERTKLTEVSSTEIRNYFQNPSTMNANVEQNIHPNVREYMKKKYGKK
ncbi:unnamed protein product [Rotaria sp. Silwood1]|nr:unnamed protein product [Rotaria sp. Silwood1]CAF1562065.1 unnamed protein product [Rotaria sp. Silwood1]CAF3664723.1 unnamed protein product [Rotaria sp. Silwood1]CAF4806735.1 unnamed protein product [Rotaria sp. Silwood1]